MEKEQYLNQIDNEINFNEIFKLIFFSVRNNKKYFVLISLIGILSTIVYTFFHKSLWQGNFQIVIEDKNEEAIDSRKARMAPVLFGNNLQAQKLRTELEILKSPSVLLSVYKYVEKEKKSQFKNYKMKPYRDWLEDNLNIYLVRATSVLNVSYKDKNIEIISPVLNKISQSYQEYSNRDRSKSIDRGLDYLNSEINKFTEITKLSRKEAQNFALKNNLTNLVSKNDKTGEIINTINIEAIRVEASNKITELKNKLKVLDDIGDDQEKLLYFGNNFSKLQEQGLPRQLDEIDKNIEFLLKVYNPNDKVITDLKKQKDVITEILKKRAYSFLKTEIETQQARLESTNRPKGTLLKYKELLRKVGRDEATLVNLENDKQSIMLIKSKNLLPWDLITSPTILDKPVSLSNKRILFYGFLSSLSLALLVTYLIDVKKGLLYNSSEIEKYLNFRLLDRVNLDRDSRFIKTLKIIQTKNLREKLCLIQVGEFNKLAEESISNIIQKNLKNCKLFKIDNLDNGDNNKNILLINSGMITRQDLIFTKLDIENLGLKIYGYMLIEDD